MYLISIQKLDRRRSDKDRRQSSNSKPKDSEMRTGKDRRCCDDRRNSAGRRYGVYRIISEHQKEKLDRIINVRDAEISDLVIG